MFKLGFFEAVVILAVVVILFGPWIIGKIRGSLTGMVDETKKGLSGSSGTSKSSNKHRSKKS
jgi:Sec-independent protein translocase protein TatA